MPAQGKTKLFCIAMIYGAFLLALLGPWLMREIGARPPIARSLRAWRRGAEYLGEEGVIRQTGSNDCGIASLQMIFRRHGIAVRDEILKPIAGLGENGVSMLNLKNAAKRFGLDSSVMKLDAVDILRAPLPLIAFIDNSHFVVVASTEAGGRLIVLDPAAGKLKYSLDSFRKRWSGEVLIFIK